MAGRRSPTSKRGPVASLAKVLAYRNPDVVERFRKEYPMTRREAGQIWSETLRWLWICGTDETGTRLGITRSMIIIDEMWHAFVLFTRDYAAFCDKYFGRFIHHTPTGHSELLREAAELRANPDRAAERIGKELRAQYELVVERLGVQTLKRWQVDFDKTYSLVALRRLRRRGLAQSV